MDVSFGRVSIRRFTGTSQPSAALSQHYNHGGGQHFDGQLLSRGAVASGSRMLSQSPGGQSRDIQSKQ